MNLGKSFDFRKVLQSITHRHDIRRVFDGFTRLSACALAAQTRESEYLEEAKRWERTELDSFAEALGHLIMEMEQRPFEDVLGHHYMDCALSKKGQQWTREFHTPKPVCDLMAQLTIGDVKTLPSEGPISVCEPACGSGAMLLSFAQACAPDVRRRIRVTAIDVNQTACDMAFINTTLWGIPARVIHGNSLSREFWAGWSNVHWIMPWLSLLATEPGETTELPATTDTESEQGAPPNVVEVKQIEESLRQMNLAL